MEPVNPLLSLYNELEAKFGKKRLETSSASDIAKKVFLYQEVSSGKELLHVKKKPFGWGFFHAVYKFFTRHPEQYKFETVFEIAEKEFKKIPLNDPEREKFVKIRNILDCLADHVAEKNPTSFEKKHIRWEPPALPELPAEDTTSRPLPKTPHTIRPLPIPVERPSNKALNPKVEKALSVFSHGINRDLVFSSLQKSDTQWKRGDPDFSALRKIFNTDERTPIKIKTVLDKITSIKNRATPSKQDLEHLETCITAIEDLELFDTIQTTLKSTSFQALRMLAHKSPTARGEAERFIFSCPALKNALDTLSPDRSASNLHAVIEQLKLAPNAIESANRDLKSLLQKLGPTASCLSFLTIAPLTIDRIVSLETLKATLDEITQKRALISKLQEHHAQFMTITKSAKELQSNTHFTAFCKTYFPLATSLVTEIASNNFLLDPYQILPEMPFSDRQSLASWLEENTMTLNCYNTALKELTNLAKKINKPLTFTNSTKPGETYLKTLTDTQERLRNNQALLQKYLLDVYTDLIATYASTTAHILEKGVSLTLTEPNAQRTLRQAANTANIQLSTLTAITQLQNLETRLTSALADTKKTSVLKQTILARPIRLSTTLGTVSQAASNVSKIETKQKALMAAAGLSFNVEQKTEVDSNFLSRMSKMISQTDNTSGQAEDDSEWQ